MAQNFQNHRKFYFPHHFVFYPVGLFFLILTLRRVNFDSPMEGPYLLIAVTIALLLALSYMMRQHYALQLQDRVVRLELRLRYFILTNKRLEPIEKQLSFGQLAAVRFASDDEIVALIQRAIDEKLSPGDIKKSIASWQADDMRV